MNDLVRREGVKTTSALKIRARLIRTNQLVFGVLIAAVLLITAVSMLVLQGAVRELMLLGGSTVLVIMVVALLVLRAGRNQLAGMLCYIVSLVAFTGWILYFDQLPPVIHLALVMLVMSAGFTETTVNAVLVLVVACTCAVVWVSVGDHEGAIADGVLSVVYLSLSAVLAMFGASRYHGAWGRLQNEVAAKQHLAEEIEANNRSLEIAVRERTSELMEVMQELAHQAITDELTGLLSRRGYTELTESRSWKGDRTWLVMVDLDGLKGWNDQFGHYRGDQILKDVAAALRVVSGTQVRAARLGGDEFAVICAEMEIEDVLTLCQRVQRQVADGASTDPAADPRLDHSKAGTDPDGIGSDGSDLAGIGSDGSEMAGGRRRPSVSIGFAPVLDGDFEGASRHADAALYQAKRAGGQRVVAAPLRTERAAGSPAKGWKTTNNGAGSLTRPMVRAMLPEQNSEGPATESN